MHTHILRKFRPAICVYVVIFRTSLLLAPLRTEVLVLNYVDHRTLLRNQEHLQSSTDATHSDVRHSLHLTFAIALQTLVARSPTSSSSSYLRIHRHGHGHPYEVDCWTNFITAYASDTCPSRRAHATHTHVYRSQSLYKAPYERRREID